MAVNIIPGCLNRPDQQLCLPASPKAIKDTKNPTVSVGRRNMLALPTKGIKRAQAPRFLSPNLQPPTQLPPRRNQSKVTSLVLKEVSSTLSVALFSIPNGPQSIARLLSKDQQLWANPMRHWPRVTNLLPHKPSGV